MTATVPIVGRIVVDITGGGGGGLGGAVIADFEGSDFGMVDSGGGGGGGGGGGWVDSVEDDVIV